MKRKAEIRFTATFTVTADITDARWKKLVGPFFEPADGNTWAEDRLLCHRHGQEAEVLEVMRQVLDKCPHPSSSITSQNSDGAEEFLIECKSGRRRHRAHRLAVTPTTTDNTTPSTMKLRPSNADYLTP